MQQSVQKKEEEKEGREKRADTDWEREKGKRNWHMHVYTYVASHIQDIHKLCKWLHDCVFLATFPGSPSSVSMCNMTFDPIEISAGSKVILCTLTEEGEPGNEASVLHIMFISIIHVYTWMSVSLIDSVYLKSVFKCWYTFYLSKDDWKVDSNPAGTLHIYTHESIHVYSGPM